MKHKIIQMTATAGLTVPHLINPIFQYIFDCLGFNWLQSHECMNESHSADCSIFKNGAQKIDFHSGCVANGHVLLKPNVVHVILFNFWKEKFVEDGSVMLAIDRNGGSLLIFEEKWPNNATVPKSAPNSHSLWMHRLLNNDVWIF